MQQFYCDVLPSQGRYCIFRSERRTHEWFDTLDELEAAAAASGTATDYYFAVASFDGAGKRQGPHVLWKRAVCLDIDAGPAKYAKHGDKVYKTQDDALKALVAWCMAVGVSPTYIVSSGAGLHVYFCLDRDVAPDAWKPVAEALKAKALADGLRIDAGLTGNPVLVLRPPGTTHTSGNPVKVLDYQPAYHALDTLADKFRATAPAPRPRRLNAEVTDALYVPTPASLKKVLAGCLAMRAAAQVGGNVPEPYWRATLGIAKFCVEGERGALAISQGHPDFDPGATLEKMARWGGKPTTCKTFEAENPDACISCKHRGTINSPIRLGEMSNREVQASPAAQGFVEAKREEVAAAVEGSSMAADDEGGTAPPRPWRGYIPEGFMVDEHGRMMVETRVKGDAPDDPWVTRWEVFAPIPYWFTQWSDAHSNGDYAVMDAFVWKANLNKAESYRMHVAIATNRAELLRWLGQLSILPMAHNKHVHEEYVRKSLERIRMTAMRPKIGSRLGVDFDAKDQLFVAHGHYVVNHQGELHTGVVTDALNRSANEYVVDLPNAPAPGHWPVGSWEEETRAKARRHLAFINKHYGEAKQGPFRLAIALAWGSPLLAFSEGNMQPRAELSAGGLNITLFSIGSGRGKTSCQQVAALAFGDPGRLVQQRDESASTAMARLQAVAGAGTLPVFMDEMGDTDAKGVASMVTQIANGQMRMRMTKDLQLSGGSRVSLVNLMSTNKSYREIIAVVRNESPAAQYRILEIDCDSIPNMSTNAEFIDDRAAIQDCRGAVGLLIHRAIAVLGAANVNKLVVDCCEKARELIGDDQEGRFLRRAFGAMLAMRRILKVEGLPLFELDDLVQEFRRWYRATFQFALDNLTSYSGATTIHMLMMDITSKTLFTDRLRADEGRILTILNDRVPDTVVARSVLGEGRVYIGIEAVRDWCRTKNLSFAKILQAGRDNGLLEPAEGSSDDFTHRVNLWQGTKYNQRNRVACWCILTSRLGDTYDAMISDKVTAITDRRQPPQTPKASARA